MENKCIKCIVFSVLPGSSVWSFDMSVCVCTSVQMYYGILFAFGFAR